MTLLAMSVVGQSERGREVRWWRMDKGVWTKESAWLKGRQQVENEMVDDVIGLIGEKHVFDFFSDIREFQVNFSTLRLYVVIKITTEVVSR